MGSKRNRNILIEKIDQAVRKTGDPDTILSAATEHLKVLAVYLGRTKDETMSLEETNNAQLSKLFFDKINSLILKKRFTCQVDENSGWLVPLLPLELFGREKLDEHFRRTIFFKFLEVADILECRVSSVLSTHYCLKVIHKFGSMRILEDLNITVQLQADQSEMSLLPKKLLKYELIRVAVKNIEKAESEDEVIVTEVIVTLNETTLQFQENKVKLGIILEKDLPSYVRDPPDVSQFKSYIDYLNSLPEFKNHHAFQEITPKFGIDPHRIYSLFSEFECMKCSEDLTGEALLKAAKKNDLLELLEVATGFYENRKFKPALQTLEVAAGIDPKCVDIYILRGRIYADAEKPRNSKKAMLNWEKAYSLDLSNTYIKEQLSHMIFALGNLYYRKKQYRESSQFANKAVSLNPSCSEATGLANYLKNKHPKAYYLGIVSLYELQAAKSKIVKDLREFEKFGDYKLVRIKTEKTLKK